MQAELVAAVDDGLLGIFAPIQHAANVFSVRVAGGVFVAALVGVAEQFERVARPAGGVFAHAPKQSADLGVCEGGVRFVEKGVHGLGDGRVAVGCAVPVVDDAVISGMGHSVCSFAGLAQSTEIVRGGQRRLLWRQSGCSVWRWSVAA